MGNLSSKDVYVKIKDENHLNELFEMCDLYKVKYTKYIHLDELIYFYYETEVKYNAFSNWSKIEIDKFNEVTTEQFEQLLKSEQQCQK